MAFFQNNGLRLHFQESGSGTPFIFQHGLGADVAQPFDLFKPPVGIRLIAFDARGHGQSQFVEPEHLGIGASVEDLLALMQHLRLSEAVVGGISMGAAIALRFALRYPAKTLGLVLSRPAWLVGPNPFNTRMFGTIARLIQTVGPEQGLRQFQQLPEFHELKRDFPDTCTSLSNQFHHPRAREMVANLTAIPEGAALENLEELHSIACPTLILANQQDPVHPYEYGVRLGELIPGAQCLELTSKSVDLERHRRETQQFIEKFLTPWLQSHPNRPASTPAEAVPAPLQNLGDYLK